MFYVIADLAFSVTEMDGPVAMRQEFYFLAQKKHFILFIESVYVFPWKPSVLLLLVI